MSLQILKNKLLRSPIILAIKDEVAFQEALSYNQKIVFLLYGDICTIGDHVKLAKEHGKTVFVHLDLIDGITNREICVDFINEFTEADGVISTKPRLLKYAKQYDFITILRIFMLDSMALENSFHNLEHCQPDLVEVLPGIATKSFALVKNNFDIPIIAGGLIRTKDDVLDAINHGASAISSTRLELCEINHIIQEYLDKKNF